MKTLSHFMEEHQDAFFWTCDAGHADGLHLIDVLAYATAEDLNADTDNFLAIARATVIDDSADDEGEFA